MIRLKRRIIFCICFTCLLYACRNSGIQEYDQMVKKELASGKHVDSLFFGMYFGMSSKTFFSYCWDMNKKGVFTDGTNNMAVLYMMNHQELKYPASMNFYPDFFENKIYKMRVAYQYAGWAPWNKPLYSDSLEPDILKLYRRWYPEGNPFIQIQDKKKGTIYVKVDGNRRITIGKYDDMQIKVDFTDLLVEPKKNAEPVK